MKSPKQQVAILHKLERPFARETASILNRYISAALTGNEQAHYRIMQSALRDMFDRRIKQCSQIFGRMKLEGKKEARNFLETKWTRSLTDSIAQRYINEQGGAQIRYISETTRKDVKKALSRSLEELAEGEEPIPAEKRIRALKAFTPARARIIAATEIHASAMYSGYQVVNELQAAEGFEYFKAWVPTVDDRTRETHAEMNPNEFIPLNQPFVIENMTMMYPGDPSGGAHNVINCRCIQVEERKEFL
jgi:hypothetical protein